MMRTRIAKMKTFPVACVTFLILVQTTRGQNQFPEAKKIMGLYNEESSWSPDGKSIAFDSSRPGKTAIFIWNIETREQKRSPPARQTTSLQNGRRRENKLPLSRTEPDTTKSTLSIPMAVTRVN